MTTETTASQPDARAEALVGAYERAGYRRVAPPILQPAEPFLDLSGEDIRKRMYLTADADGRELCLRPDLTIPVSCDYLASPAAGSPQGFCYLGPVYRDRGVLPAEIVQAGIESFGRPDKAAADAEMLALGLDATAHYGIAEPEIRMGDVGLFAALVAALDLAPAWKRRLVKDFNRKTSLAHDLDVLTLHTAQNKPEYQGVLAALESSDPKAAHALVTDLLSIAGINTVGGRTVGEIAERFLEQAALGAATTLPRETRTLIEKFLAIAGDPDEAAAELRALAASAGSRHRAGARPVRKPRRISRRARRRRRPHPLLDRLRPRPRLLHRLRVRAARSGRRAERPAGRRRPLRRTARPARREIADPRGGLRGVDRARRGGGGQP